VKAVVEYDGGAYAGFQRQASLPTIQGALEEAITAATGGSVRASAASRTDAGAHARGQVVSFLTDTRLDDPTLLRALNAHLPRDIVIQSLQTVDVSFDPRRQALRREYHYLVVSRPVSAPLWSGRAYVISKQLDLPLMRAAAQHLVGIHDFASFGTPAMQGGCTVREIFHLRVVSEGELIRFEIVGSGFLQHMIRSIVGTLLDVGSGRIGPETMRDVLESRDRRRAAPPAPAHGLYLVSVLYGHSAVAKGPDA